MDHPPNRYTPYLPLLFAILLLSGVFIGTHLDPSVNRKGNIGSNRQYDKVNDLISYIENSYVDTVNKNQLYDAAVNGLLQSLDPHSQYIPATDFHEMTDPLKGNFEGIGIQFRIIKDSLVVINTIPAGPSAKAGLRAGDRIVTIGNKSIVGVKMTDNDIVKQLKGPKGSKVELGIFRKGYAKLIPFTVTRDVIPTYSVDASYIIQPGTAYLKVSKFSATTSEEVADALSRLKKEGMQDLILDLRDNAGGYLQSAINLSSQFLPEKAMIVYTKGRKRPKQTYFSDGKGLFRQGELIILMNEGSASASEILAGAVQDNDRGLIIGRRSFGKGLVQEELDFNDGSAARLTVARYYTPTGRCIQKPYEKSHEDYSMEAMMRLVEGEMEHPDSIRFPDSLKYTTPKGKTVYGGGGIMPDIYVPLERSENMKAFNKLVNSGLLYQFAFDYTDRHRLEFSGYANPRDFDQTFQADDKLMQELFSYSANNGTDLSNNISTQVKKELKIYIKSLIARVLYDDNGFYPIYNRTDKTVLKALEVLSKNKP